MTLQLDGRVRIENLGNYPQETVEKLRTLLVGGAAAQPDPRRKGFYDVHNCSQVFFIHISPVSGNVMLLASWFKEVNAAVAQAKNNRD